jgi:glycosyltransferase involved in cell wall biosynthesis
MACGTPVIGSTNSGAEDLFTDGVEGFIVPARDPIAIRDRVKRLLDEPDLLARMKAASLQRVQSIGGWAQYGQMCRDIYRRLLNKRGSPALMVGA